MGTNYYWYPDPCSKCGHGESKHIGKSSAGWVFALHIYPEDGIHELSDWEARWNVDEIRDEYAVVFKPQLMREIITDRACHETDLPPAEFLALNYAYVGEHGLLRSKYRDTVPGAGSYDLVQGDFS